MPKITVKDLIIALNNVPQDAEIICNSTNIHNPVSRLIVSKNKERVFIEGLPYEVNRNKIYIID